MPARSCIGSSRRRHQIGDVPSLGDEFLVEFIGDRLEVPLVVLAPSAGALRHMLNQCQWKVEWNQTCANGMTASGGGVQITPGRYSFTCAPDMTSNRYRSSLRFENIVVPTEPSIDPRRNSLGRLLS